MRSAKDAVMICVSFFSETRSSFAIARSPSKDEIFSFTLEKASFTRSWFIFL